MRKPQRAWRIVERVGIVVFVCALIALGVIGYIYLHQSRDYEEIATNNRVQTDVLAEMTVDWDSLRQTNPDIVAWVVCPGTPIDYPVVLGDDNEEYLHKSFEGVEGVTASSGCIFADCACVPEFSDTCIALYGHHMRDGSMFASVAKMAQQDFFDEHRTVYVLTPTMNYELTTFATVLTNGSDAIIQVNFNGDEDLAAYLQDKVQRSVVQQSDVDISSIDRLFALSTCEYSQNDGRAVVFAAVTNQAVPTR